MMEIERIERSFRITECRRSKLELAGAATSSGPSTASMPSGDSLSPRRRICRKKAHAIQQEIESLRESSRRTVPIEARCSPRRCRRVLGDDQMAAYREAVRESRRYRHRRRVTWSSSPRSGGGVLRRATQRLTQAAPPGDTAAPKARGREISVVAQASRMPESKFRPIFDDSQWRSSVAAVRASGRESEGRARRAVFTIPTTRARPVAARPGPRLQ